MAQMTLESIELKNVKVAHHMSEETIAFTATLYINGKKAAHVKNDGRGGDNYPRFLDRETEKEFHEFCATLPLRQPSPEFGDMAPYPMTYDSFIGDLLDAWMENDDWKRKCKKNVIVILKKHSEGQYGQYKNWIYTPVIGAQLRTHYGSELVEIVNERFI